MSKIVNKPELNSFVFYSLLLIPTFFLCYEKNIIFFVVIVAMLLTSVIEIPVFVFRTKKPLYSDKEAECLGEIYGVPIVEEMQRDPGRWYKTRITLNLGGFIIPLSFSLYLILSFNPMASYPLPLLEVSMITLLMVLFSYMLSGVKGGVGILVGMLIVLVTRPREEVGSAFYNIGGIGSFHALYLISFLALLIGSIIV